MGIFSTTIYFIHPSGKLKLSTAGLQHQLNLLARNADSLDLTVNLEKSNNVVFM